MPIWRKTGNGNLRTYNTYLNDMFTSIEERKSFFIRLYLKSNWRRILYVHTPFCLSKCSYCVYSSKADYSTEEMRDFYESILPGQISEYGDIMNGPVFDEVYFGGGTPTISPPDTLRSVFDRIPNFKKIGIKSIEASPYTITEGHISLFQEYGFNFVSIGVQSLSERVLKANCRSFVPLGRLAEIAAMLDKAGIVCNMDLICYLDTGDISDAESFEEELSHMMSELRPTCITIHPSYYATHSVEKTLRMLALMKSALARNPEYRCINSILDDGDAETDREHLGEFRLMRASFAFQHYMWGRYAMMPSFGTSILSIGYIPGCTTRSCTAFAKGSVLMDTKDFSLNAFEPYTMPLRDFLTIRNSLGLPSHQSWKDALASLDGD